MPGKIEVPLEHAHAHIEEAHEEQHGEPEGEKKRAGGKKAEGKESWTRFIAVVTALLTVVAAIGALRSELLVNGALIAKNDEISSRTQATDQWSFYQAKSIKGVIYAVAAAQEPPGSALAAKSQEIVARYEREQAEIKAKAEGLEKRADASDRAADRDMDRHHIFASSVSLCQIAIGLSAIAALTRSRRVWFFGLAAGLAGFLALLGGLLGMHLPFEF